LEPGATENPVTAPVPTVYAFDVTVNGVVEAYAVPEATTILPTPPTAKAATPARRANPFDERYEPPLIPAGFLLNLLITWIYLLKLQGRQPLDYHTSQLLPSVDPVSVPYRYLGNVISFETQYTKPNTTGKGDKSQSFEPILVDILSWARRKRPALL
jgi:hypothetical protein